MSNRLYFAYGSNLNAEDCQKRGLFPDFLKPLGIALLPDWELVFNYDSTSREGGALNLRERVGQLTAGVIFEVPEEGWEALDRKEGAPHCYGRREVTVLNPDGEAIEATTYIVRPERRERGFVKPTPEYVSVVSEGLASFGLSDRALKAAASGQVPELELDGLFVYGTLIRGEPAFELLEPFGLECTLLAETPGRLVDRGAYPGMISPDCEGGRVQGEFVRVRDIAGALKELDRYEGFHGFGARGSLFERRLIEVDAGDGRIRLAWCYMLGSPGDDEELIPSGDWRVHKGTREAFLERLAAAHAGGDESRVVRNLIRTPLCSFADDPEATAWELLPLSKALSEGRISERRLAQASERRVTILR